MACATPPWLTSDKEVWPHGPLIRVTHLYIRMHSYVRMCLYIHTCVVVSGCVFAYSDYDKDAVRKACSDVQLVIATAGLSEQWV